MPKRRPPSRSGRAAAPRRGRRGLPLGRFALVLLAGAALFAVGVFFGDRLVDRGRELTRRDRPAATKPPTGSKATPTEKKGVKASPSGSATAKARVAIVVDDLGHDPAAVERLLALDLPLSYAVLPFEPHSVAVAQLLRSRGAEILLHLPMAPAGGADPGVGAITERMSPSEAADATRVALDAVAGAVGVNNHMGSAVTADRDTMAAAVGVLSEKGLFFLDSRTSADSVGYDVARAASVPTARRDLFLDEVDDREAIGAAIDELIAIARTKGAAIGIAHPRAETLAAFERRLPRLAGEGVELVPVSFLLERAETLPE